MTTEYELKNVFQRGRWIIIKHPKRKTSELYHQCRKSLHGESCSLAHVRFTNKIPWALARPRRRLEPAWRCQGCGRKPPDSIVGVYSMLESKYVGAMMSEVLNEHSS